MQIPNPSPHPPPKFFLHVIIILTIVCVFIMREALGVECLVRSLYHPVYTCREHYFIYGDMRQYQTCKTDCIVYLFTILEFTFSEITMQITMSRIFRSQTSYWITLEENFL